MRGCGITGTHAGYDQVVVIAMTLNPGTFDAARLGYHSAGNTCGYAPALCPPSDSRGRRADGSDRRTYLTLRDYSPNRTSEASGDNIINGASPMDTQRTDQIVPGRW